MKNLRGKTFLLRHFDLQARLYHELDMLTERNQASAELLKLEEQHPSNVSSKMAVAL